VTCRTLQRTWAACSPRLKAEELTVSTRQFTTADGLTLVGDVAGDPDSPAVILMHGGGQTRHSWSGTLEVLADAGYRVISYDSRGHGESGWSAGCHYSYPDRARDLASVVAGISQPFALVGASMGGITAMQSLAEGLRPRAVVLVDIVLRPSRAGVERIRKFMLSNPEGFPDLESVADAIAAYNPHRPRPKDYSGLKRNLRAGPDNRFRWHWDPRILAADTSTDLQQMEEIIGLVQTQAETPILLVRGMQSDVLSDENVADFRQLFPWSGLLDIAGAGHMVAGDSNDVFSRGILGYLKQYMPVSLG
jgi:pimeloyl-ACP methyl ester carboxylesterase